MHAKSGLRVFSEWKIYRPDSVITAVMRLKKMKHSTFLIFAFSIVMLGCGQSRLASESGRQTQETTTTGQSPSTDIKLGMSKDVTSKRLAEFGANDISSGMQAAANAPKSDWMWSLASPKLSIETLFDNDKLVTLNIWDWRGRKMTSYHHTMEYDQVDTLTLNSDGTFDANVIQTFNGNAK